MAGEKKSRRAEEARPAAKTAQRSNKAHKSSGFLNMDPEQSARVLLIGGVAAVILIALAFVAFGWYWTERRPLGRTVLQVDDVKVSFSSMKRRMSYELFQSTALQSDPSPLATVAFDNLLQELVVLSRADDAGAVLDPAKVDADLRSRIGVPEGADQRTFQDRLRSQLDATGLKETEFRRLVEATTAQQALKDKITADLPPNITQAKVEVINTESREKAQEAIDRINAGEAFGDVARDLSLDPDRTTTGGLSGFEADGGFPDAYNDFAFTSEVGALSEPLGLEGIQNFYVVRVVERSEQPVRDDQKPALVTERYEDWLASTQEEMRGSGAIVDKWDTDDQAEALVSVIDDATPRIIAQRTLQAEGEAARQTAIAEATLNPAPTPAPPTPGAASPAAQTPAASPETEGEVTPPSQPVAPSVP